MLQNEAAIHTIFIEAQQDEAKMQDLLIHPDAALSSIGVAIPSESVYELKEFLEHNLSLEAGAAGTTVSAPSIPCVICYTSAWALAASIVAIGAAGITSLTATSPVVFALAAWAGVAPAAALTFISSIATSIAVGVGHVAHKMCEWVGYCS